LVHDRVRFYNKQMSCQNYPKNNTIAMLPSILITVQHYITILLEVNIQVSKSLMKHFNKKHTT